MSDSSDRSRRKKNFTTQIPKKILIFGGDCHLVNEFLATKSEKSVFVLFHYLNSILRSFGHVIFANNPISGLIILVAIGSANGKAMLAALLTSSLSFAFAKILQQDILGNSNGFFGYNAVLHAVESVAYLPALRESTALNEPRFWMFLVFVTLVSVYVTSAFANLFRHIWHHPIPCFTIPFHVLQYVLIFCLVNNAIPSGILPSRLIDPPSKTNGNLQGSIDFTAKNESDAVNVSTLLDFDGLPRKTRRMAEDDVRENADNRSIPDSDFENGEKILRPGEVGTFSSEPHLNWGETFSGTIVALSRVYGLNDVPCSILMFLALVVYSPTTALFCYAGSFAGTILGLFLSPDMAKAYDGTWGYNGLLCGGALAGFGFVLTAQSAFLALTAVLFCTAFQHFITPLFDSIGVPMFHVPFIVTAVIFLLVTAEVEKALPRPGIYSYPERHRQEFKNQHSGEQRFEGYLARARISES